MISIQNPVISLVVFIICRLLMRIGIINGNILPYMIITMGSGVLMDRIKGFKKHG